MQLSIVVPVLNEAQTIPLLLSGLHEALSNVTWEVIFVDDGSTDDTWNVLERSAFTDAHVKMLRFSRNFGHQAAVTAGLDFASGQGVLDLLRDLNREQGLTMMLVTHDQQIAQRADRVVRLAEGRIELGLLAA